MPLVLKFPERIRSIAAFLEDELNSIVIGFTSLFERQHRGLNGQHTDITADSLDCNAEEGILSTYCGQRWLYGPWAFDLDGNTSHQAVIRPPQITANTNDYKPSGINNCIGMEVTSDAARDITGIYVPAARKRLLIFGNRGSFTITLKHASASSTANYRFNFHNAADVQVPSGSYILLYYDVDEGASAVARWRTFSAGIKSQFRGFRAERTSSQVVATATYTKVQLTTETFDTDGWFDNATNYRFQPTVSGYYRLSLHGIIEDILGRYRFLFYKNGTAILGSADYWIETAVTDPHGQSDSDTVLLNGSSDYIELYAYHEHGANRNVQAYMIGEYLGS